MEGEGESGGREGVETWVSLLPLPELLTCGRPLQGCILEPHRDRVAATQILFAAPSAHFLHDAYMLRWSTLAAASEQRGMHVGLSCKVSVHIADMKQMIHERVKIHRGEKVKGDLLSPCAHPHRCIVSFHCILRHYSVETLNGTYAMGCVW